MKPFFNKINPYSRRQSWRRGIKCDCKTDWLWVRSPLEEMKYLLIYISISSPWCAALSSATQHAMPPESGTKWETECLNTKFPLPTLPCAGFSMKLIYLFLFNPYRTYTTTYKHLFTAKVRYGPQDTLSIL